MAKKSYINIDEHVYKLVLEKKIDILGAIILSEVDYFSRGKGYFKKNDLIAEELNVSSKTISRTVKKLVDLNLVETIKIKNGRIIKVTENYIEYCSGQIDHNQVGSGQIDHNQVGSGQNVHSVRDKMSSGSGQNVQDYTIEKNIEKNLDNNKGKPTSLSSAKKQPKLFDIPYFENTKVDETFKDFISDRELRKKPMTEKAIEIAIRTLNQYDDNTKIAMIEQSIMNGYQGLFPVKQNNNYKNNTMDDYMRGLDLSD